MAQDQTRGQLVIIGGAEDKQGECEIMREFVRCAGGTKARIVVLTAATEMPREVGEDYTRLFERLGADDIRIIDTESREDAASSTALKAVGSATGIFFTGGDQARIMSVLKDTEIDAAIHHQYRNGVTIGGTSAGAAVMPDIMIVQGDSQTNPRIETVEVGPGMGFLPSVIIDQHFSQRGRLGRLISALAQQPAVLGFGIDENTAMIVTHNEVEIVGEGCVTVVDASEVTYSNIDSILRDEALAMCGAKLHILPRGFKFHLETRQTILEARSPATDSELMTPASS